MKRIDLVLFITFFVLLPGGRTIASPGRPNVILVLTDDQGYGDLSCHGNPVLKTPILDRLHDQSVRLTDFHVAPMCTPTRGQLLTGVDALRNGAMNVSSGRTLLRKQFPTMPEIFAANGYRTAIFGKWHLGDNYPYRPEDRGLQETLWFPSSHVSSAADYWQNDYFDDVYVRNGRREPTKGYCTDLFFGEAMRWMRGCAAKQQPFFCYLPLNAPHGPLFGPAKYRESYQDQKPGIARFFGMIACIDENMGKLLAFLEDTGLAPNTILIFMTDNGTATGNTVWNAGMRGKKIDLYDGGHRVPFFIRWPSGGLRPPGDLNVLATCQDVLPTLIELCNLKKHARAKFDGVSLAGLLRGRKDSLSDRRIIVQFSRMNAPQPVKGDAAVLWNKWRLVSGKELYDISVDPGQQRNVLGDFPDVARRMSRDYDTWWRRVAPRVNEFSPISIGQTPEEPVRLTPCDWRDVFLDQQAQVRNVQRNGAWKLLVERPGNYEFALRRWPAEANLGLTDPAQQYKCVDGLYGPGKALPIAQARLRIGTSIQSADVSAGDKQVVFQQALKKGACELQTWFLDAQGNELCGAYYVYVRPVNSRPARRR